jgi:hypothetical protein
MKTLRHIRPSLARWAPVLVLLILAAGTAAHFGHHLLDPDCGSDSRPAHATCQACSALHGGLTSATGAEVPTVDAPRSPSVQMWMDATPIFSAPRLVSSRGPPSA